MDKESQIVDDREEDVFSAHDCYNEYLENIEQEVLTKQLTKKTESSYDFNQDDSSDSQSSETSDSKSSTSSIRTSFVSASG